MPKTMSVSPGEYNITSLQTEVSTVFESRKQGVKSSDQIIGLLLAPALPSCQTSLASSSSYTPKGLDFHGDLLGLGSAHIALPCPHLDHSSRAKPHCLPETIPGSGQVSCPPGQQCLAAVSYTYRVCMVTANTSFCFSKPDSTLLKGRNGPSHLPCQG